MLSNRLRCVFVTIPPLLSAIISETLSRRIDLQLLGEIEERDALAERLEALSPDLAVVGLAPGESDQMGALLLSHLPKARIILIASGADYACLYEMRSHREVLFDFSPDTLLTAILGAGAPKVENGPPEI
jgi:chemotaxis response regulator CheB